MKKLTFLSLCLIGMTILHSCKDTEVTNDDPTLKGFIYTTTNGESTNQVLKLDRYSDGSVANEVAYSTKSLGGANTAAGGDAKGDFDSQNAIQIIGDYLLAVNAGGNEITTFEINRANGALTFKNNVSSGGKRPVSIAYTQKSGSNTEYWVVVGNQWDNPNVQKDGADIERYPNDAWFNTDLSAADASDAERNIALFSFNSTDGTLSWEIVLDNYPRINGGPTCVAFSDDGSKLAVTTWGIAHFGTALTSLDEQSPSRVYAYDFNGGAITNARFFEEEGIAGSIGFNWAKGSNSILHVSNFNLLPTLRNNSLTVLEVAAGAVTKSQNFNTAGVDDIDEACWTLLNDAGDKLHVASFGANTITRFNVNNDGSIANLDLVVSRAGVSPPGDTKDMYITPDGEFFYVLGAYQTFSINRFDNATLEYQTQDIYETTMSQSGNAGENNFLGIAGFDL